MANRRGSLHFEVDASLLFHLGEELVNKRSVALAELIKNAYDADSSSVKVVFERVREPGGTISIIDDGNGMTFDAVCSYWMRIATTTKNRNALSTRYQRPVAGAKGIGRFAARRLGDQLEMTSTARIVDADGKDQLERTTAYFDWRSFEPGARVEDIPVTYERTPLPLGSVNTGVTLRIGGVRDAWTEEDLDELRTDLLKLISPAKEVIPDQDRQTGDLDPGFFVVIEAPEFPDFDGNLGEEYLSFSLATLTGLLTSDGTAHYKLAFRARSTDYELKTIEGRFPRVGPANFTVHFFVYKKEFFAGLPMNTREAQRIGRDRAGVYVYVDRFRVAPYGDPGDDWLKLDQDRARRLTEVPSEISTSMKVSGRPMLLLPGNNQLFGRVHLARLRNPSIRQTSNRERFIENEAFKELREFVRLGIDWMTVQYAQEYEADRSSSAKGNAQDTPSVLISKASAKVESTGDALSDDQRAQILQALRLAHDAVEEHQADIIGELSMLRVLASTGTMIVVFQHQLAGTLLGLKETRDALVELAGNLPANERDQLDSQLERLTSWIDTTHHQGELLGLLVARSAHSRRRRIALNPVVEKVKEGFDSYATDNGIELDNRVPVYVRTPPIFEAELTAMLINLLTNAFKAVREQPLRRVSVEASRNDDELKIRVSDTGKGLQRKDANEYFRAFVGDSEPDPLLGHGTGLGLKIVKDFVEAYGGTVQFVRPSKPWHTAIEIVIPDR